MVVVAGTFAGVGFFLLGGFVLFWQLLYNSIQDVVEVVTFSQPEGGENSAMNEPTTMKTNSKENPHKQHKGHP